MNVQEGETVFVVQAGHIQREMLAIGFRAFRRSIKVIPFTTAEAAKSALDEGPLPNAVIIGTELGGSNDASHLLRTIRRTDATSSLPVIVMTADPDPTLRANYIHQGATAFISLPISLEKFETVVETIFQAK